MDDAFTFHPLALPYRITIGDVVDSIILELRASRELLTDEAALRQVVESGVRRVVGSADGQA